ncbi:unnamed protein product [Amaranthus hypochondriacus]
MAILLPCLICVSLILHFPITIAQTNNNITIGSSLTAGDQSTSWASPSQDFAFGFQEVEPENFLLAIWFNKIPEKTITWYANRDHLAPKGSKVELTINRGLTLTDPNGKEIWRAMSTGSTKGETLAYAAMLDIGNFVLASQASAIIWQSFDEPTDTLLPTQTLNPGKQLLARYTEMNFSSGRFSFKLTKFGNLALYTTNFPLFNTLNSDYRAYEQKGLGHQVVFNQSGNLYLVGRNSTILTDMFSNDVKADKQVLYWRVILEYDGVLRRYVYEKPSTSHSGGWSINSFAPDNICIAVIQNTGSGVCGYNSYCELGHDSRPHCICPPGYTLLDPDNKMGGCFQNFLPQNCGKTSQDKNQFDLKVLQDVDWPLSDSEFFQNVSIDWCREVCLADCFCAVGIFKQGGDCWKKKVPLTNGKNDTSVDRIAFIKVRISGGTTETQSKLSKRVWTALLAILGTSNLILLSLIIMGFFFFTLRKAPKVSVNYNVRCFSYKELTDATNGFSEELGRGAFGVVFKGVFSDLSGAQTLIAVKKLDALSHNLDKEFKAEVNSIGHTHHKNLVKLIGSCEEGEHRMLVYEFMSNGTLSNFLYQHPKPSWVQRLRVAQGIARGLFYLHEDCSTQVIHCDLKPQNILLDDDHNARISDFGLAKLLKLEQTQTNTEPRGTRGYVAPEWFKNIPITAKVDVYSFGILLLEIICCKRNVQGGDNEEEADVGYVLLTDKAIDCYQMDAINELVEDDMDALNDKKRLERMVKIVIWCIQDNPNERPSMRLVIGMLEGLIDVPEPPYPATYTTTETM